MLFKLGKLLPSFRRKNKHEQMNSKDSYKRGENEEKVATLANKMQYDNEAI